jgi:cardiolipin synthase A/B
MVSQSTWAALALALVSVMSLLIKVLALGFVPRDRKPSTGIAWLMLVLLSTWLGLIAFALFGRTSVGSKRLLQQEAVNREIATRTADLPDLPAGLVGPPYLATSVHLNRALGSLPMTGGNTIEYLPNYNETMGIMAEAVRAAESYVLVEFYISAWDDVTDPVLSAMAEAAERGVEVKFLFDHLGSRGIPGYKDFVKRLDATKIEWYPMLPLHPLKGTWRRPDLRNHRKLLVVDGHVGFMGSLNLIEAGYNKPKNHESGRHWVDLMMRAEGPLVTTLESVFAVDWEKESGYLREIRPGDRAKAMSHDGVCAQVLPSGPGFAMENNLRLFNTLIYGAQRRLSLTSPYFVPDESLLYAVTTAAQRGVDVELFVSEESDQFMVGHAQASYYKALLEAGIKIWLYPAPAILHSKHFTVDDDIAVIGSSNMDMRSFALNYEIITMLIGGDAVPRLREIEDTYRTLCRPLTLEEWSKRSGGAKYVDTVMRLTSALQ